MESYVITALKQEEGNTLLAAAQMVRLCAKGVFAIKHTNDILMLRALPYTVHLSRGDMWRKYEPKQNIEKLKKDILKVFLKKQVEADRRDNRL